MKRATLILLFAVNFAVNAQTFRGGEIFRIKDSDVYWAAVKTEYFVESVARQEEDNWCWAACIQAVLRYHDMRFSQSDIVRQVYDDSYDWTASGNRIAQSLNGWNNLYVYSYRDKSIQVLIDNLIKHSPLIIGNAEHAYLLTHIYYTHDNWDNINPFKVILINPMTAKKRPETGQTSSRQSIQLF